MIQTPTTSTHFSTSAALVGLVLALGSGCTQKPACDELGTCGGVPTGDWALSAGHPSCTEELYRPPADPRLLKGDQPPARLPLPDEAFFDWCDQLIFKTSDMGMYDANHVPRYSFTDQDIGDAWIHYDGAGNYAASLTKTGRYLIDFPSQCVRSFGAKDDATGTVCQQVQTFLIAKGTVAKNVQCVNGAEDAQGCLCRFDIATVSGGSGQYFVQGNTISHALTASFPAKNQAADFPSKATFCAQGGRLQLTGADGAYLFNQPGLRTLDLGAATINCADGVRGPGEEGVDCGVACPMACP